MENNLHLTLSNIIKNQNYEIINSILGIQGLLISDLESAVSLFICAKDIIHHSLVDFLPTEKFENASDIVNYKRKYQDLIVKIAKAVEKSKNDIENNQIVIGSVYKGEKSIALEAYPSQDILSFAEKIKMSVKTEGDFPKVKGFPPEKPEKFAINIIRFFRKITGTENQIFNERVVELNQQLENKPIIFNLKNLSLVISDDYLSNPNPEVANFIINLK